jgi:dTDP-glucose 4,6-dehydratase
MNSNYIYPVNIGNPCEISVKELAKKIIHFTNSNSTIVYHELPLDDPTNRKPDISKANEILDWSPKYDLEKGLKNTIHYFASL